MGPDGSYDRSDYERALARIEILEKGRLTEGNLLADPVLDAVAKILHTFGCVRNCPGTADGWRPNARIVIEHAIAEATR